MVSSPTLRTACITPSSVTNVRIASSLTVGSISVAGYMDPPGDTLLAHTPLKDAAARLCAAAAGCLPVVEQAGAGPRIVGLLTETDLLRGAFERAGIRA